MFKLPFAQGFSTDNSMAVYTINVKYLKIKMIIVIIIVDLFFIGYYYVASSTCRE